jgi:hypothetical protein
MYISVNNQLYIMESVDYMSFFLPEYGHKPQCCYTFKPTLSLKVAIQEAYEISHAILFHGKSLKK